MENASLISTEIGSKVDPEVESEVESEIRYEIDRQPELESKVKQIIDRYFQTLNAEEFQATANLFISDGVLHPPLDTEVRGRGAIVTYLESEARGMQLLPGDRSISELETGEIECKVTGKVQTSLFSVNVAWRFILNPEAKILFVKVKLLAALEELLNLRF